MSMRDISGGRPIKSFIHLRCIPSPRLISKGLPCISLIDLARMWNRNRLMLMRD
jgi:hypothetical protein